MSGLIISDTGLEFGLNLQWQHLLGSANLSGLIDAEISIIPTNKILHTAVAGDLIATFSVTNGNGTYTYAITADPDGKFVLDVVNTALLKVKVGATFLLGDTHSITVEADNGVDAVTSATFSLLVVDTLSTAGEAMGLLLILTKAT
jgi:hypothetical protein